MDRLVKRTEGIAADHSRIAMSLTSLTETSNDTYATDTNEIPLLNDGLTAMSKHLRTYQSLLEDESRGWDEGVLEDLKRQRDSLVGVREMFERREKLDKDNIPYLERRIQTNETKLAGLRSKPDGLVKPGEIDKVAEAIIKVRDFGTLGATERFLRCAKRFNPLGQRIHCSTAQPIHLCQGMYPQRAVYFPEHAVPRQPVESRLGRRASQVCGDACR